MITTLLIIFAIVAILAAYTALTGNWKPKVFVTEDNSEYGLRAPNWSRRILLTLGVFTDGALTAIWWFTAARFVSVVKWFGRRRGNAKLAEWTPKVSSLGLFYRRVDVRADLIAPDTSGLIPSPIFQKGQLVGYVIEDCDISLLKAEFYKERVEYLNKLLDGLGWRALFIQAFVEVQLETGTYQTFYTTPDGKEAKYRVARHQIVLY